MSKHAISFFIFCLLYMSTCALPKRFRFAVAFNGRSWDLGWAFNSNLARIALQKHLEEAYPTVEVDHVFDVVPEDFSPVCDPRFVAWAKSGIDLIIAASVGYQFCVSALAASYPNVTFVGVAGAIPGPPNYANLFVRFYQATYLAGYLSGLVSNKKKVCVSACVPFPTPVMDVTGFSLGVHDADPSAEIHILGTGTLRDPLLEVWIVNQSYALGCDVIWLQTLSTAGMEQAHRLGMMSIGFFLDARLTIGESVITSAMVDSSPLYIRTAEALLNGTFRNETQRADWWMGWEWGAMRLGEPSFLVPKNVSAKVKAQEQNVARIFCRRFCTKKACLCNTSDCCVTDAQLSTIDAYPDFTLDHGIMKLPGLSCKAGQKATWHLSNFTMACNDCPAGTYSYNYDEVSECRPCPIATYSPSGATNCTVCPAGTYGDQQGLPQCTQCPAGSIAANPKSSTCNTCFSGISNEDSTACLQPSLVWLAGVGGGVLLIFIVIGIWAWSASRKMRAMRKQFSNANVAVECAAAIARLDLNAVAWLNDISKPNCIQLSFIRIVKILEEVRKYVPDQLLQSLTHEDEDEDEDVAEDKEEGNSKVPAEQASRASIASSLKASSIVQVVPVNSNTPSRVLPTSPSQRSRHSRHSTISMVNMARETLFEVKKVTYMQVNFNINHHQCNATQAESKMKVFLSHLIDTAKAQSGTVGNVLYDTVIIHWGTGRRAVSEAPAKAVETALALTQFSSQLQDHGDVTLCIAIGCGSTTSGIVETASNRFFVVGGGQVPLVQRIVSKDWKSIVGAQIIITDAVRASVHYNYQCHPRFVDGDDILWEPLSRFKEKEEDELMYQLQDGEESAEGLKPAVLLAPFTAARKQDFATAESLIKDIRQKHKKDLQPNDIAALDLLSVAVQNRSTRSM